MKKHLFLCLCAFPFFFSCSNGTEVKTAMFTRSDIQKTWMVEYIEGTPVIKSSSATITFTKEGKVSGNSSCNRLMSSYQLVQADKEQNSRLTFSQTAGTMMMCPEAIMLQEQQFLKALSKVSQVKIQNGFLLLLDDNQSLIIKASARKNAQPK